MEENPKKSLIKIISDKLFGGSKNNKPEVSRDKVPECHFTSKISDDSYTIEQCIEDLAVQKKLENDVYIEYHDPRDKDIGKYYKLYSRDITDDGNYDENAFIEIFGMPYAEYKRALDEYIIEKSRAEKQKLEDYLNKKLEDVLPEFRDPVREGKMSYDMAVHLTRVDADCERWKADINSLPKSIQKAYNKNEMSYDEAIQAAEDAKNFPESIQEGLVLGTLNWDMAVHLTRVDADCERWKAEPSDGAASKEVHDDR